MLILLVSMVNRSAIILKILQILNNARKNLTALIIHILCCWLTQAQGSASQLYIQRTTIRESQDPGKFNSILFFIFEQIKADSDNRSSFKLFSSSHFLKKKKKNSLVARLEISQDFFRGGCRSVKSLVHSVSELLQSLLCVLTYFRSLAVSYQNRPVPINRCSLPYALIHQNSQSSKVKTFGPNKNVLLNNQDVYPGYRKTLWYYLLPLDFGRGVLLDVLFPY